MYTLVRDRKRLSFSTEAILQIPQGPELGKTNQGGLHKNGLSFLDGYSNPTYGSYLEKKPPGVSSPSSRRAPVRSTTDLLPAYARQHLGSASRSRRGDFCTYIHTLGS